MQPDADAPHQWQIRLTGDVLIANHDGAHEEMPNHVVGLSLLMTIMSELDTRLVFGLTRATTATEYEIANRQEVVLTAAHYSITDASYNEGQRVYPQRPDDDQNPPDLPPDPSDDFTLPEETDYQSDEMTLAEEQQAIYEQEARARWEAEGQTQAQQTDVEPPESDGEGR